MGQNVMNELAEMLDGEIRQGTLDGSKSERAGQPASERLKQVAAQLIEIQDNEHRRVAALLHNGIGQSLSIIKLGIEAVLSELATHPVEDTRAMLETLRGKIRHAMDEVHQVTMTLRPSTLDDFGIVSTLKWFLREFQTKHPTIAVTQHITVLEDDIPLALKTNIFRMVEQAMNDLTESPASHVSLYLGIRRGRLEITIESSGPARDAGPTHGSASGAIATIALRDRVMILGGDYLIEDLPGQGSIMRASWPAPLFPAWPLP